MKESTLSLHSTQKSEGKQRQSVRYSKVFYSTAWSRLWLPDSLFSRRQKRKRKGDGGQRKARLPKTGNNTFFSVYQRLHRFTGWQVKLSVNLTGFCHTAARGCCLPARSYLTVGILLPAPMVESGVWEITELCWEVMSTSDRSPSASWLLRARPDSGPPVKGVVRLTSLSMYMLEWSPFGQAEWPGETWSRSGDLASTWAGTHCTEASLTAQLRTNSTSHIDLSTIGQTGRWYKWILPTEPRYAEMFNYKTFPWTRSVLLGSLVNKGAGKIWGQ